MRTTPPTQRRFFTVAQESEIRGDFFRRRSTPEDICRKWRISMHRLRVLIGGPLKAKTVTIEKAYG
jgi:predicted RNA-binding protein (virulence factor B family)